MENFVMVNKKDFIAFVDSEPSKLVEIKTRMLKLSSTTFLEKLITRLLLFTNLNLSLT